MARTTPLPPSTVLVVDDERGTRRLIHRILSDAGYRVFEAQDGVEALDTLHRIGRVDLVVVDIVMPRKNGPTLVRELLERDPRQRVLYMSAYAPEPEDRAIGTGPDEPPFLPKPFSVEQLLAKVDEALRQNPAPTNQRSAP